MSLILEALKKSEAERQLGRAPGLLSPTVRVSRQRGPSAWWGVILLAAAVALGAGWWLGRAGDEAAPVVPVASTPAPTPAPTPASPPAPVTTPDPAPQPAPAAVPPTPTDAPVPSDPAFASVERESLPVAARATPAIAAPRPVLPVTAPPPPPLPATVPPIPASTAPPPEPVTLPAETPSRVDAASPALPAIDTSTQPARPAEAPLEALPSYNELMPDVRATLPALKLSMHVYAADPAARFVLIDGKRLAQGDRLAPSLVLEEIRRDGAVLDFGGKRFVVPRP